MTPRAPSWITIFPPGFTGKLAQETRLSLPEVAALLREYRRFLLLAGLSGQPVTPSRLVDEAWHLHLTHSRDYWERLVPLLGRPLHHEPARSAEEHAHYQQQYLRTLDLYRTTFGSPAPAAYWPDPRSRVLATPPAPKMTALDFARSLPTLFRPHSRLRRFIHTLSIVGILATVYWMHVHGLTAINVSLLVTLILSSILTAVPSRQNRDRDGDVDFGDGDGGDGGNGGDGGGCGGGCGGDCGS